LAVVFISALVEWEVVDLKKGTYFWVLEKEGGSHGFGFFWNA
jgi:hypothetical protein